MSSNNEKDCIINHKKVGRAARITTRMHYSKADVSDFNIT